MYSTHRWGVANPVVSHLRSTRFVSSINSCLQVLVFVAVICLIVVFVGCSDHGAGSDASSTSMDFVASPIESNGDGKPLITSGSGLLPVAGWSEVGLPDFVGGAHMLMEWTGNEILVWGDYPYALEGSDGSSFGSSLGAAYDPETDDWRRIAAIPKPARSGAVSVWTGSEVIVCCGQRSSSTFAYTPQSDTWLRLADAPTISAFSADAVWTGAEMLVANREGVAVYQPEMDEWELAAPPPARLGNLGNRPEVAWTGTELIVWPASLSPALRRGLAFDPGGNTWRRLPEPPAWPAMPDVVWTGEELILWGGLPGSGSADYSQRAVGSAYDPSANTWTAMPDALPEPESFEGNLGSQTLIWTGTELIVSTGHLGTGLETTDSVLLRYQPRTQTWDLLGLSPVSGYNVEAMMAGNRIAMLTPGWSLHLSEPNWRPKPNRQL